MTPAVPTLLAAAVGAGVLVGCTDDRLPSPVPSDSSGPPDLDLDATALVAAHGRERALLAAYADPGTVNAGLTPAADEARVHHVLHLRAIEALMGDAVLAVARAMPTPTPAPSPAASAPAGDAVALARSLLSSERAAADAGILAVGSGVASPVRRLLAEIAASEAQHATALYIGLREGTIRRGPAVAAASP